MPQPMNVAEFDISLSELETRVDRLRALYENWFRGYEKMEPSVARKDVERRVYGLRKELPRNTALRFRYHQLYQRYTTLATYWQRTARQIEEGTYRLQLQRMKRRRPDDDLMRTNIPPPRSENEKTLAPPSYELNLEESLDVQRLLEEADIDQVARAIDIPGPFSTPAPVRPNGSSLAPKPGPQVMPATPAPAPVAPLASAGPVPPTITSARFARPSVANDVLPIKPTAPTPGRVPPPLVPAPPGSATGGPPKPPKLVIPLPSAPGTGTMPGLTPPRMTVKSGGPGTGTIPALPPRVPAPPSGAAPAPSASTPAAAQPPMARPAPPAPPTAAARPPPPSTPRPAAQPSPSSATAGPQRADSSSQAGLSDQRLRRIYDEYAAARRKNNEGDVRFETLAGTIQKMLPDLSKKHQGKQIDFEVVLKDGRVGLKPKAT